MKCPSAETIALYAGGDLPEPGALEQHLAGCPGCAQLARALESDRDWLASVPPELAEIDFDALRPALAPRPWRLWPALLAAAAVLAAIAVTFITRDAVQPMPPPPPLVAHIPAAPTLAPAIVPSPHRSREPNPAEPFPVPANAFRVPTHDPNVVIVWFTDTKGDSSNE